ncbi:pentatricopeptide repeat-containing protein ELI1, chloroplastic-like [Zingiber officinale]|uniref:pentatricopeptide repeat-containing protein ELI1, chloroplastic-like n=1 Tax=Zingiber officinale TaxID=94328 RepID=UPI001C4CC67F|nr:pentatricopeptide repeat-containing protein ELI1, chloroplastic-like [Zingiber officinale]XP_042458739.1 pentatricopeptide repeat-containing protein ELI1, chloroplastic-like [Zingiber officinale]
MASRNRRLLLLLEKCQSMRHLKQTQAQLAAAGIAAHPFAVSRLLAFCSHPVRGCLRHSRLLFRHAPAPTLCIRNTMIKALLLRQHYAEPFHIYRRLLRDGLSPDNYTLPYVLKACAGLKDAVAGAQVHAHTIKLGFFADTFVCNTLALVCFACGGDAVSARQVFDGIPQRDAVSWTVMISGYGQLGDVENARLLFDESPLKDHGIWGAIISAYVQNNCFKEGLSMFRLMQAAGLEPDEGVLVTALSASAQIGALDIGIWIHQYMNRSGLKMSIKLCTALMDMYLKCGNLNLAKKLFDAMTSKDTVCWNVMILGLAIHGHGEDALKLFACMMKEQVKPDDATYIAILTACSHSRLVEEGLQAFDSMNSYGIEPKSEHYVCMVDSLGRAGYFKEAQEIIGRMSGDVSPADKAIAWRALLSACWNHGDTRCAEVAARHLLESEVRSSGYVLLSNIHETLGKDGEEARRIRKCMKDRGILKLPGCSSIQAGGHVHEFIAGEQMHPEIKEIHSVLETIHEQFLG